MPNWSKGYQGPQRKYVPKRKSKPKNKKVKTNKQLTRAVKKLWAQHEIKSHYVDLDFGTIAQNSPQVIALTGIGSGSSPNTHEGNAVKLRGLNIHGVSLVGNSGNNPAIPGPRLVTIMVVRSELGTGVGETPTFTNIFRDMGANEVNFPLTENFRGLDLESTTKIKILKKLSFYLEPHGPQSTNNTGAGADTNGSYPTYPSCKKWSFSVPVRGTIIRYREGTSTTLNQQLFLMAYCNSTGGVNDTGPGFYCTTKLTFYDVE